MEQSHSLIYLLTYLLHGPEPFTYLLTYLLNGTKSFTYLLTYLLNYLLTYSMEQIPSLIHLLT